MRSAPEAGPAAPVGVRGPVTAAAGPDRWLRPAGPVMALLGVVFAAVVIPLDDGLVGRDLGIGLFYFIVVVDFVVLGLSLAGWGANTRASVEVYYRATAQLVAYVVPLGLAYIGAVMMARSLSTVAVVRAQQDLWFVVLQPLGFVLYLVTGLMQAYRAPFIEPFSASIAHGVYGSSAGWQAVLWRVALSGTLLVVAAMGAVLFLGGWQGPVLPGPAWMALKTFALLGFMVWAGSPRHTAAGGAHARAGLEGPDPGRAGQRPPGRRVDPAGRRSRVGGEGWAPSWSGSPSPCSPSSPWPGRWAWPPP